MFAKYVLIKVVLYHYAYCLSKQIYKLALYHNNTVISQTSQKATTNTGTDESQEDFGLKAYLKIQAV
jgi:hypothetical protein